jgi:hypothetical protein
LLTAEGAEIAEMSNIVFAVSVPRVMACKQV